MAMMCVILLIGLFASESALAATADYYTAAVYDHAVKTSAFNVTSRYEALQVMTQNLDILSAEAAVAHSLGSDIFVFPEYGITGLLPAGFLVTHLFTEMIPDPRRQTTFCPCEKESIEEGQEVLHRLSCTAKQNNMYIAANMGDTQPCLDRRDGGNEEGCPLRGYYQYNTEVVFNRSGCLVAKYHKEHLFESETLRWNRPKQVDVSYFDTDFDRRFGLMICFDVVFRSPAVDLVEQHNVTDIIFSTAWMNVYPHYISVAYHSGWARTMQVNFLASNLHNPPQRFLGSGVYGPAGVIDYIYNSSSASGSLLVTKIPINRRDKSSYKAPETLKSHQSEVQLFSRKGSYFLSKIVDDMFKFQMLTGDSGHVAVCEGAVCCRLEFSRSTDSEFYALGVFNGLHNIEAAYYMEVCLLVRCAEAAKDCGTAVARSTVTHFEFFNLTGHLSTKYAFPEVVTPDTNFSADWEFEDHSYIKSVIGRRKEISSVVLMGRNFEKDPSVSSAGKPISHRLWLELMLAPLFFCGLALL